jgi:hypothetical protein
MNLEKFFTELQRRNIYKVAVAYAVVAWLLIQVATQVFPFFEIPNWTVRFVVLLIIIGFPIALGVKNKRQSLLSTVRNVFLKTDRSCRRIDQPFVPAVNQYQ